MDEIIIFLMRCFSWELEYTVNLVNTLPLTKLNALIKEAQYQKAVDEYNLARYLVMASRGKGKVLKDFIGDPPSREIKEAPRELREVAEEAGIKMPEGE